MIETHKLQFVRMIYEYIISRTMANKITDKKFGIGGKEFQIVGKSKIEKSFLCCTFGCRADETAWGYGYDS